MDSEETITQAREELKRADHLIFVSLKYTRTCDIFKSIVERLINALDSAFTGLLERLDAEKKIFEMPDQPGIRCGTLREHYPDAELHQILDFYLLLRQINRADFSRAQEFRRHVTMTVLINGEELALTIDNIGDYYKRTKNYVEYMEKLLNKK